ncbi:DUF2834 domain-containing protein [Parvibaculum sp.]|jgi:hypothetical protein|uniref:DUF2834 domain-containing protein n=1 Tax=Parvibaculum sp. TaxID=2024848 RepID=UPI001B022C54|nr:DUF2834 domain-containing protein [Parvibaculum sp.]MBO6635491.1 DUF2834 domain-containing protein [Parvibaculum sp.]MBO6677037.1 DUF2834 domain-containing protein [Parvibaculum sp.]MBO6685986.1 DUF2834 domain-containing protein [Parvibaculum sp.]MBO6905276.1 DUF2834 domain-containing protein [Parvibaculum sp.]
MTNSNRADSAGARERLFKAGLVLIAAGFAVFFFVYVLPPVVANPDMGWLLGAGFVNPVAAGYSTDTIMCWFVLATWVVYERVQLGVKHGWVALLLGLVPGVATGFALYLLIRMRQRLAAA